MGEVMESERLERWESSPLSIPALLFKCPGHTWHDYEHFFPFEVAMDARGCPQGFR